MDTETFITAVFCLVGDFVRDLCRCHTLRRRGPAPVLADSEVLTIESVGEFLGLDTDRALHAYFRGHFGHLCLGLGSMPGSGEWHGSGRLSRNVAPTLKP